MWYLALTDDIKTIILEGEYEKNNVVLLLMTHGCALLKVENWGPIGDDSVPASRNSYSDSEQIEQLIYYFPQNGK